MNDMYSETFYQKLLDLIQYLEKSDIKSVSSDRIRFIAHPLGDQIFDYLRNNSLLYPDRFTGGYTWNNLSGIKTICKEKLNQYRVKEEDRLQSHAHNEETIRIARESLKLSKEAGWASWIAIAIALASLIVTLSR